MVLSTFGQKEVAVLQRFSSIEPKTPPPGQDQIYLPDDDQVFTEEKDPPSDGIVPPPPTPGTAPAAVNQTRGGWSQRKLGLRNVALIVVGVVAFLGLAAGIAVAIIVVNTDRSSSSSSSSLVATPAPVKEIQYNGYLKLGSPWQRSESQLQDSLSQDLNTLMSPLPMYKSYLNSSLQHLSTNKSLVSFSLTFAEKELHKAGDLWQGQGHSALQAALRNQVVTQSSSIRLPILADSIVILENIPIDLTTATTATTAATTAATTVPTTAAETTAAATTAAATTAVTTTTTATTATTATTEQTTQEETTTTATTISTSQPVQCLPMTFDPCLDLLGSRTFQLPNWFEHVTVSQAESAFAELLSTRTLALQASALSNDSSACEGVSTLYLCALMFPPCGGGAEADSAPLHPCDSLCQDTLEECGPLAGWPTDCQNFPTANCTANLLPTTTATTTEAPSTEQTTTEEATTEKTTAEATTTTATTTAETTTSAVEVTTEKPFECVQFDLQLCNDLGFNETILPNKMWNCDTVECLIQTFNTQTQGSLHECDQDLTFFCSYIFHGCSDQGEGYLEPVLPCSETCDYADYYCTDVMLTAPNCSALASGLQGGNCVMPQVTCVDVDVPMCRDVGITSTYTSHDWDLGSYEARVSTFKQYALPVIGSGCYPLATFYYCGLYFPPCQPSGMQDLPCVDYCQELNGACPPSGFLLDCEFLEPEFCLNHTTLVGESATPTTTEATTTPTTTTTTTTGPITPTCEPLESDLCKSFGFTHVTFPNAYGGMTQADANKTYYEYAEQSVSSGCTQDIAFYICTMLFPPCEGGQQLGLPCRGICEDVNANCPLLFTQKCSTLTDPNEETCLQPPAREGCQPGEFRCVNSHRCIPDSAVCDKRNDCQDWSDERNCKCHPTFEVRCQMGLCIPAYNLCDDTVQCPDHSDEGNCEHGCVKGQYSCRNSTLCIQPEWICDVTTDCPEGDDEEYCHFCSEEEFSCYSHEACVPRYKQCDGSRDCQDGSDELECVVGTEGREVYVKVGYLDYPQVCSAGFTQEHGQTACMKRGTPGLGKIERVQAKNYAIFFQLDLEGDVYSSLGRGYFLIDGAKCPENEIVMLSCNVRECGIQNPTSPNLLIGGLQAPPGAWPWVASLQHVGIHICGGAIFHPYFVLTAAHCMNNIVGAHLLRVVAGTVDLTNVNQQVLDGGVTQIREVRRYIMYPGYSHFNGKDMVLVELTKPLDLGQDVKPVCFPDSRDVFTRRSQCFLTGWGRTSSDANSYSPTLQESKMSLLDTSICNGSYMWNGAMSPNERCAGYYNGMIAACQGDSGSPVSCRDLHGFWKIVGVTSYVRLGCDVPRSPMVFTDVMPFMDWIKSKTECVYTCSNGICLFDKEMLCDTHDDCGDRSDEIQLCPINTTCTFDHKYLCGYRSNWVMAHTNTDAYTNSFPLFDHTIGRYPGMYQQAKRKGVDMFTPRVDVTTPHCIRFHYHMRGQASLGLTVYLHSLQNSKWREVWQEGKGFRPDIWFMGTFDLEPGNFDIDFRPHDSRRVSLDDIYLLEGTCDKLECFPNEFMCETLGKRNCLPLEVKCNIVVDCDQAVDEIGCEDYSYRCDFENGNLCGIRQHSDDATSTEWALVNSTQSAGGQLDHSTNTDSGFMFKIDTTQLMNNDRVKASMDIYLREHEHCMTFVYFSNTQTKLKVTMETADGSQTLLTIPYRVTDDWVSTQLELPAVASDVKVTLTFTVRGSELVALPTKPGFMIDDLVIVKGECPIFTCPQEAVACKSEPYCVPTSRICDQVSDCISGSDEIYCTCTDQQFKCPLGPCISRNKTCDYVKDCPDGGDEGLVCDDKRSVSCDFEDVFQCGYIVNTTIGDFHWTRRVGRSPEPGPTSDHTHQDSPGIQGHYLVGNNQMDGSVSSLTSSPFTSTGTGLVFHYHAHSLLPEARTSGELSLVVSDLLTGDQTELWHTYPDHVTTWRQACVTVPPGRVIISFVLVKGVNFPSSIAVDDVRHLKESCDSFNTGSRILASANLKTESTTTVKPSIVCPPGLVECRGGMCIDAGLLCDGFSDCPDSSDEFGCKKD